MFGSHTMITLDIDPALARDLAGDFDRRERLEDKILEELRFADVQYEVHIVESGTRLQLVIDLGDVIGTIENTVAFFDGEETEDDDSDW
jgi:hypothetical protein